MLDELEPILLYAKHRDVVAAGVDHEQELVIGAERGRTLRGQRISRTTYSIPTRSKSAEWRERSVGGATERFDFVSIDAVRGDEHCAFVRPVLADPARCYRLVWRERVRRRLIRTRGEGRDSDERR